MKALVCTDGSKYADAAVKFSAQFADNYGADLTMLYVIASEISRYHEYGDAPHEARKTLENAKKIVSQIASNVKTASMIAEGDVASEIVKTAEEENFDFIVIGTRGTKGIKRMLLGSVASRVIQHAHCPVAVVR
ncbi:MAG: universal stress protein [Thermodesulfobacteriota bacterium]|nr:universal stress protein [Thermodesulfobacteriota bacterium]